MLTLFILCVLLLIIISMYVIGFAVMLLATVYFFTLDIRKGNHANTSREYATR
jgi:hypothetical protein